MVFADGTESIHLADLSGDGLDGCGAHPAGLHGDVCYWPNLGYGRFGAKVTMDHAPVFDHPELFDPKRLRLADIDGSGTTDLIYLHREGVRLYFNQSGNSWSEAVPLAVFPPVRQRRPHHHAGSAGQRHRLLWSGHHRWQAIAGGRCATCTLMGEGKPHLLTTSSNNLGAETRVRYCSSTALLPGGQAERQALDHAAAVPGARGRAGGNL